MSTSDSDTRVERPRTLILGGVEGLLDLQPGETLDAHTQAVIEVRVTDCHPGNRRQECRVIRNVKRDATNLGHRPILLHTMADAAIRV